MTEKKCTLETCDRPHLARGYCKPHYRRWVNYGDPTLGKPLPEDQESLPEGVKRCSKCAQVKPLDGFSPDKRCKHGRSSYCKTCKREQVTRLSKTPREQRRKPGRPTVKKLDRNSGSGDELHPRKKYDYPGDRALVNGMRSHGTFVSTAESLDVPWSCLKDWLNARPGLRAEMEGHRIEVSSEEERIDAKRRKSREYQRRIRSADPNRAREVRREQMRKYGPEYRRKWNTYNRLRREKGGGPLTQDAIDYLEIIRADPCVYCGELMEHADHIEPICLGGDNRWDNFAPACASCNLRKQSSRVLFFMLSRLNQKEQEST